MKNDDCWLDPWHKDLLDKNVLELGCDQGADTKVLTQWAENVIACDIKSCTTLRLSGQYVQLDHSKTLPFASSSFDVVVASLSLHYFDWVTSRLIVNDIWRVLKNEGQLICRVNSDRDDLFGASGYPELEAGLHNVDGIAKRFFNQDDIYKLFKSSWSIKNLQRKTIDRYSDDKRIWQFSAFKK